MLGAGISVIGGEVTTLTLDEPSAPAAGLVVIEVRAAGVGNWDELVRVGSWRIGGPPPMALGVEAAGRVVGVGPEVARLAVGDEVLVHTLPLERNGTWAQRMAAPAALVAPKPASVDFATAAAFAVPALTAAQVIDDDLAVESGERLTNLTQLLAEDVLTIEVAAVHPLGGAGRALADASSGHMTGAVVISL